jgi:hypothetical protein
MPTFRMVLVKEIDAEDESPTSSAAYEELQRSVSKSCIESLLYLRPLCVSPTAEKRWRAIAGRQLLPIVRVRFKPNEHVPVLVVESGEAFFQESIPLVESLFASILNLARPKPPTWNAAKQSAVFGDLGSDLKRPEVASVFLKGEPRQRAARSAKTVPPVAGSSSASRG